MEPAEYWTEWTLRSWLHRTRVWEQIRLGQLPADCENCWQEAAAAIIAQRQRAIRAYQEAQTVPADDFPYLYTGLMTGDADRTAQFDTVLRGIAEHAWQPYCTPFYGRPGIRFETRSGACVLTPYFVYQTDQEGYTRLFALDQLHADPESGRVTFRGHVCKFAAPFSDAALTALAALAETAVTRPAVAEISGLIGLLAACGDHAGCEMLRAELHERTKCLVQENFAELIAGTRARAEAFLPRYTAACAQLRGAVTAASGVQGDPECAAWEAFLDEAESEQPSALGLLRMPEVPGLPDVPRETVCQLLDVPPFEEMHAELRRLREYARVTALLDRLPAPEGPATLSGAVQEEKRLREAIRQIAAFGDYKDSRALLAHAEQLLEYVRARNVLCYEDPQIDMLERALASMQALGDLLDAPALAERLRRLLRKKRLRRLLPFLNG